MWVTIERWGTRRTVGMIGQEIFCLPNEDLTCTENWEEAACPQRNPSCLAPRPVTRREQWVKSIVAVLKCDVNNCQWRAEQEVQDWKATLNTTASMIKFRRWPWTSSWPESRSGSLQQQTAKVTRVIQYNCHFETNSITYVKTRGMLSSKVLSISERQCWISQKNLKIKRTVA